MKGARCAGTAAVLLTFCFADGCSRGSAQRADYREIIDQVTSGMLVPDKAGVVKLPANLRGATVTGEVYVTKAPSGATLILFPTWIGKAFNLRGHLYCSKPLGPGDTYDDGGPAIDLYGPVVLGAPGMPSSIQPYERWIEKKINDNWYVVYRNID